MNVTTSVRVAKSTNVFGKSPTGTRAVEDGFCLAIKVSQDGAVVLVAGVDQTLSGIFKQEVALTVLLRLKEFELCVRIG